MKQTISVLMDGELFEDEAEHLFDNIKRNASAQTDWEIYHLIGDVLRQPDHIHCGLSGKVRERMHDEPAVLAPRKRVVRQKVRTWALSAAASLSAVGVVAWMSLQISPEVAPHLVMQQTALNQPRTQARDNSNDYLLAHQELSPSTDLNGGTAFIRTVSYSNGVNP